MALDLNAVSRETGDPGKEFDESLEHSWFDGMHSIVTVRIVFSVVINNIFEASCDIVQALFPWESGCLFLASNKNTTNPFLVRVVLKPFVQTGLFQSLVMCHDSCRQ